MGKFHDCEIIKYEVDLRERKVSMYVQSIKGNDIVSNKLIFLDVIAHCFNDELAGSTILDIELCELHKFIKDNENMLRQRKDYLWPMDYNTIDELEQYLKLNNYSYYCIFSSYGLNGWILSKGFSGF